MEGASGCASSNDAVAVWHVRHAFIALWQSWAEKNWKGSPGMRAMETKRTRETQKEGGLGFQLMREFSLPF